jgi:hypothetical protein
LAHLSLAANHISSLPRFLSSLPLSVFRITDNPLSPPFLFVFEIPTAEFGKALSRLYESGEVEEEEEREDEEETVIDAGTRQRRNFWAHSFRSLLEVMLFRIGSIM